MALDGVLLNRITTVLNDDTPMKINRITQPSPHEFILQCFAGQKKYLYISTHPVFARMQWTTNKTSTNLDQTHLLTLMRKHLEGGIITRIEQFNYDRVVSLHIEHRDDMGVVRPYRLIVELLGKYANVIIVDENDSIVDALKRISPFENKQRAIVSGSHYDYPPQFEKKSFLELADYSPDSSLKDQFNGISPLLDREITHRLKSQSPADILEEIQTSNTLYVYEKDYHLIQLTHLETPFKTFPIMEGLDAYYRDLQEQDRIKTHTGDLSKLIRRELKRSNQKLPKLQDELKNAQDSEHLRTYGDVLFAFASDASNGKSEIQLSDFEGNQLTIPLDPRYGGKDNAKRYFKQYQKAKTSLKYLEAQIETTQNRIDYFEALKLQVEQASVDDAKEIQEELQSLGIIRQKKTKHKPSPKKKKHPNYTVIHYDADTTIYVGKNNLQNEYITFKLARKEDMWFHAAYDFGAHVLIQTPSLDEDKIRLCAHLAAYFSKSRHGSSVEVHYTHPKNLKKIPGANPGMVSMSAHKSIYIDPDETLIAEYIKPD